MEPKYFSAFKNVSNKKYQKEKFTYQVELLKLQEWALLSGKRIAIVFEGRDAAGKGSAIKRLAENLMTKHHRVVQIGSPTPKQNKSWFHGNTLKKKCIRKFLLPFWITDIQIMKT